MNTERVQTPAERALSDLRKELQSMKGDSVDLERVERRIQEALNARGRELMADAMAQADTGAPEIEVDGQRWGNRRRQRATYETVFGSVPIERSTYQQAGRGRVAIPMDLRLGIVEGTYTPRMGRILSRALAAMTEDEAAALLAEVGTAVVSNSTIGRLPRAMAARYETGRAVIEVAVRERDVIPGNAVTVQVGLDGVMVPQDGEYARPRGRKTAEADPPRHELRYGAVGAEGPAANDGTVGRAWHEASVGTLAYFDLEGRRLKTVYLARMPEAGKATLVADLEAELQSVVCERPTLNVVLASDGAAPQWTALDAMAARLPSTFSGHTMKLVDAFHVAEYLQKGANAIDGVDEPDAKVRSAMWREILKEKDNGIATILRSMRAHLGAIDAKTARAEMESAINYLDNQNAMGRMAYPEAIRRKYPIGTGITEAAGKTIVSTRMKRAGARFSQHGGQTVMLFRAAVMSERFDALHCELHATYKKVVTIAA